MRKVLLSPLFFICKWGIEMLRNVPTNSEWWNRIGTQATWIQRLFVYYPAMESFFVGDLKNMVIELNFFFLGLVRDIYSYGQ